MRRLALAQLIDTVIANGYMKAMSSDKKNAQDPAERWAEHIKQGVVTPAKRPLSGPPPRKPVMSHAELMAEI